MDTWDLYVGNVAETVSESQILEYAKSQAVDIKNCWILPSKVSGTKSARVISVLLEYKDKVLDPEFWPEHVKVQ